MSLIPPGAEAMLGDDHCVGLGHSRLSWSERISYPWVLPWRGRRTEVIDATCGHCGRRQSQVRIVFPAGHTIRLPWSDGPEEGVGDAA